MRPISEAVARAKAKAKRFAPPRFDAKAKDDVGELYIYDDIGAGWFSEGVTPKGVADALKAMGDVKTLNVYVNSPGGSVFDGVAIYNQIRRFDAKKVIHIDGIAASAASMISMAGDEIVMAHNAQIMIHDAWGYAVGNAEEMRATADLLEKITLDTVLPSYARTGQTTEQLRTWMRDETWMNAEEALAHKFCDRVTKPDDGEEEAAAAVAASSPVVAALAATRERIADLDRGRFLDRMKQRDAAGRGAAPGQPGRIAVP